MEDSYGLSLSEKIEVCCPFCANICRISQLAGHIDHCCPDAPKFLCKEVAQGVLQPVQRLRIVNSNFWSAQQSALNAPIRSPSCSKYSKEGGQHVSKLLEDPSVLVQQYNVFSSFSRHFLENHLTSSGGSAAAPSSVKKLVFVFLTDFCISDPLLLNCFRLY